MAVGRPQHVLKRFLTALERDFLFQHGGVRDHAGQCPLQVADVRGDPAREKLEHRGRYAGTVPGALGLGLQDAKAELVRRRMHFRHQTPAETRAHALVHVFEIGGQAVARHDDLLVLFDQRIERVEELFLRRILAAHELHVIDEEQIGRPDQLLERHDAVEPQGVDELVHEFLGADVQHPAVGPTHAEAQADGVHQVALAEAHPAVDEQRIVWDLVGLGDVARRRVGELVRLADDEGVETVSVVQPDADSVFAVGLFVAGRRRFDLRLGVRQDGLHHKFDRHRGSGHRPPQRAQAIAVSGSHPIPQEPGRHRECNVRVVRRHERHRFKPTLKCSVAQLVAELSAHLPPLFVDGLVSRHPVPPAVR